MYRFKILPRAEKDQNVLERKLFEAVDRAIRSLAENPRPSGCVKLSDEENGYRIQVRHIRIVYQIDDKAKIVVIYRVKHRREVYR